MNSFTFFAERCKTMYQNLSNQGIVGEDATQIVCAAIKAGILK